MFKVYKNIKYTLAVLILISANLFSQTITQTAVARVTLIRPLAINLVSGSIDFGQIILTGTAFNRTLTPDLGAKFQVIGHPNRPTSVTFNNVILNNNAWVFTNGGTTGTLNFTPSVVHTGSNTNYVTPTTVTSGNNYNLVNVSGQGHLYLWAGGTINISGTQPHGQYIGTFTISVSY